MYTGFIWEKAFGEWDYGIPPLACHVRENAGEMVLAILKEQNTVRVLKVVAACFPTGSPETGAWPNQLARTGELRDSLAAEPLDKTLGLDGSLNEFLTLKLLGPPDHRRLSGYWLSIWSTLFWPKRTGQPTAV